MSTFFIAGVQRSGTTLLAEMLSRHPDILLERRSVGFRIISAFKSALDLLPHNLEHDEIAFLEWLVESDEGGRLASLLEESDLKSQTHIRSLIQTAISQKLSKQSKKIWGDKSPNIQFFLPDLLWLMPETKILHIVRDGRATAYSRSTRSSKSLMLSAQMWVDGNISGLVHQQVIGKNQYMIIHYEQLLQAPEQTMIEVCKFLNLGFNPAVLNLQDESTAEDERYVKSFFDQTKINKWRTQMSERQILRVESIQGPLLRRLGYALVTPGNEYNHRPLSVWKKIYYNQRNNFRQLFISKRVGMVDRKNVPIKISWKSRIYSFFRVLSQDLFSMPIFKTLFPRVFYKNKYYKPRDKD